MWLIELDHLLSFISLPPSRVNRLLNLVNQLKNRDKSAHDFAGLYLKIRIRIRIGIRKIAHSAIEFERIAPSPFSEGGGGNFNFNCI